jgi:MYXO-CTERM domain-containing protein
VQFTKAGKAALIGAALMALSPVPATAAETTTTRTTTQQNQGQQDSDIPWGLAGLLGLLGLLGLRKKERDIHVDARHRDDTTTRRP